MFVTIAERKYCIMVCDGKIKKNEDGKPMGKGSRSRVERAQNKEQVLQEQQKQQKKAKVRKGIAWASGVAIVGLLGFAGLFASGVLQRNMTAMTVGGHKVTALEYQYYYDQIRGEMLSYGSQLGLTDATLDDTMMSEDQTYGDYFREQTESNLSNIYALYSEAQAQGHKMSEKGQASYDSNMTAIEDAAKAQKMSANKFVKTMTGISLAEYKKYSWNAALGQDYYDNTQAKDEYTQQEMDAYYKEHAGDYDKADYRLFHSYFTAGDTAEQTTKNKEEAKKNADAFLAAITDEKSFAQLARQYAPEDSKEDYAEDDSTLEKGVALNSSGVVADWVQDPARKPGDKAVLEIENNNYSVVYFVERYMDPAIEGNSVDVRHILLKTEGQEEEAVKTQAEGIFQQWKDGDKTEDSFAQLAKEHTQDGNAEQGGLYEAVLPGDMVTEFNDWIFDTARKSGDTDIVKTTYGYHIMYFVGENVPVWQAKVTTAMEDADYKAYVAGLVEKVTTKVNDKVIAMVI